MKWLLRSIECRCSLVGVRYILLRLFTKMPPNRVVELKGLDGKVVDRKEFLGRSRRPHRWRHFCHLRPKASVP